MIVRREETDEWSQPIPPSARVKPERGDRVQAGEQLTEGSKNPREVLRIQGIEACQMYLLQEVQRVYRSQGVGIHDKHIEVVVRQMIRKAQIRTAGDSGYLPGELVDRFELEDVNSVLLEAGKQPARADTVLLGVTKASLNTDSWLAAASFQETTRVLTEAAVKGKTDPLRGLKENVIIGKLIPVGTGFASHRTRPMYMEPSEPVDGDYDDEVIDDDMLSDQDRQFAEAFGLLGQMPDFGDFGDDEYDD